MGYQRSTLKLVWPEDSELHGLEVRLKRLSVGQIMDLSALGESPEFEKMSLAEWLAHRLEQVLISWNLDDADETPVPATADGIRTVDIDLVRDILDAATAAVARPAPPLPGPSSDGEQSPEASIPTETLSPNPAS